MTENMHKPRIEHLLTNGVLMREAQGFEIENNVWLIGDDKEVIIIDAAHDAKLIAEAVGKRTALGILLTHGHEDHINAALETASLLDTQLYLHPDDLFLWREIYTEDPDFSISHGQEFHVAGVDLVSLHTPGHTPGSVSFAVKGEGVVFSGDTLFHGGPGATRWEYSDFSQIINSIQKELFALHDDTLVLPGHGASTSVKAEKVQLESYISRGW
ncbi:MAG TPA: MBL fold metallo-hydrolase [Microbacteriaceae bacterium]|nr:MBL fold metallo-hydrolase [Microbacteriaceae bacterium]